MEVYARTKGVIVARGIVVEEFIDTALEDWEGGDVDVDVVPKEEFMRQGKDDVRLAVFAVGQEKNLLHLGYRLEYGSRNGYDGRIRYIDTRVVCGTYTPRDSHGTLVKLMKDYQTDNA